MTCPCGSGKRYADCCKPLHRGKQHASSAEALMRSRYAAYHEGEVKYLIDTLHPSKRRDLDRKGLAASARDLKWTRLKILAVQGGSLIDLTGVVEFEAHYEGGVLHERSNFVREGGRWYYVDGAS
jgi:SEC-C motif-containing protein